MRRQVGLQPLLVELVQLAVGRVLRATNSFTFFSQLVLARAHGDAHGLLHAA